jgi:hypothetical protein
MSESNVSPTTPPPPPLPYPRFDPKDRKFAVAWQWTSLIAFILRGVAARADGDLTNGNVAAFFGDWTGRLLTPLLFSFFIAYFARGRKGQWNGFDRWFFWSFLAVCLMVSASLNQQAKNRANTQTTTEQGGK